MRARLYRGAGQGRRGSRCGTLQMKLDALHPTVLKNAMKPAKLAAGAAHLADAWKGAGSRWWLGAGRGVEKSEVRRTGSPKSNRRCRYGIAGGSGGRTAGHAFLERAGGAEQRSMRPRQKETWYGLERATGKQVFLGHEEADGPSSGRSRHGWL